MKHLALLLAALPALADATDFTTRVAAAKAATATHAGYIYDTAAVPAVHNALLPCIHKGDDPASGGSFTLVADIDAIGRLSSIEVRPASSLARCFARSLGAARLRPPPLRRGQRLYPFVVEMNTRP